MPSAVLSVLKDGHSGTSKIMRLKMRIGIAVASQTAATSQNSHVLALFRSPIMPPECRLSKKASSTMIDR